MNTVGRVEQRVDHEEAVGAYDRYTVTVDMPERWNTMAAYRLLLGALELMNVPDDAYVQVGYPQAWANWRR